MSAGKLGPLQLRLVELITTESHDETGSYGEEALVVGNAIASASERFEVYRRGYVSRLVECLADDYPAVRSVLGETAFERLSKDYIERHPSTSFSLNGYGSKFALHLAGTESASAVVELAQFEWAIVEVIHAPTASAATLRPVAQAPAPRSVELTCNPAARLLATSHAIAEYHRAVLDGRSDVSAPQRRGYALVSRRDYRVHQRDVELEPGRVLSKLMDGWSIDLALQEVQASPEQVQQWFTEWVQLGVLRVG